MATVYEFNYTGREQSVTLKPGKYKMECYGASGGINNSSWDTNARGGYSKGELILNKLTTLYVYVGETGFASSSTSNNTKKGFNGGGKGYLNQQVMGTYFSMYGGGATDIRLVGGVWDNSQSLLSRIIVAGGGGGAYYPHTGGAGGGLEGGTGYSANSTHRPGGTQYQGGIGRVSTENGSFGKGCSVITGDGNGNGSGGGGGWFGGSAIIGVGGAGGGSGYVLTKDSYKPIGYIPTKEYWLENVTLTVGGNAVSAHGYCRIALLQALPFLNISSYNSTQATFKADHTDPTLLTKIEIFIDDVLKETIATNLTEEKIINYTLEDNALHTLKIVVTDSANTTAEKIVSISKNIMPLGDDASLQDIASTIKEMKQGLINGKTSIIDVLALKNIESSLNNSLVELSEKVKESFDSSDASVQELQNRITELTNQLSQRKRYARGVYTFTQNDYDTFYAEYKPGASVKTLTVPIDLDFSPSLIIIEQINLYDGYVPKYCGVNNLNTLTTAGYALTNGGKDYKLIGYMYVNNVSSKSFTLNTFRDGKVDSSISVYRCKIGESFIWYAYQ